MIYSVENKSFPFYLSLSLSPYSEQWKQP